MKKFAIFALCILLVTCLLACGGQQSPAAEPSDAATEAIAQEPTVVKPYEVPEYEFESKVFKFPEGTTICGVDVSGMLRPDAYAAICEALNSYTLNLSVNGKSITLRGDEIGLTCPETTMIAFVSALENGEDPSGIDLLTYDSSAVRHKLAISLNVSAKNATIRYNSSADCFQLSEASSGKSVDLNSIMREVEPVILSLGTDLSVSVAEEEVEPSITADSDAAKNALARANAFLSVSLTYSYTPDNSPTKYESISKDTIGSFITFGNDLTAYISSSALRSYVNDMSAKYSVKGNAGQFKTTGGYYISLTVDYAGQPVNTDALYDDIHYCLSNGISGTRVAPYLEAVECEEMAFDGNYVEVNLSAQHLWVYRNGNCVVSTPIVSGCAYYRMTTPTGVYSIYSKARGVTLVGEGYASYVNYWMPFRGGYGLHDASWRSSFGGDIYLYDGSHGCVNLPSGVAGSVYDNVYVGTKVILYGGATSAEPVQQNIIGTTEYNVPMGTAPFKLDAQPEYGEDKTVTYASSNPEVAEVAADGTVTIKAPGTAYILVSAAERQYYTSAQLVVTINVYDQCQQDGHSFGDWNITTPPSCTAEGSQWRTCGVCGETETEVIPVLGHSFGEWSQTSAPTCTLPGERIRTCGVCSAPETETIPATGHSVSQWNTDHEPSCTETGSKSGVCGTCGETVTEEIPMKEHDFSSGGEFCDYGCGTVNPNFLPPQDEEEDGADEGGSEDETTPT